MTTRARYPELINLDDPPTIVGQECGSCGRRAFPPDPYGCERCGAEPDRLASFDVAAIGTVNAVATVHRHHHPRPETPFTVATIVLDDGITLKAVLDGHAAIGARVCGVLVPWDVDTDGVDVVDLRFTRFDDSDRGER